MNSAYKQICFVVSEELLYWTLIITVLFDKHWQLQTNVFDRVNEWDSKTKNKKTKIKVHVQILIEFLELFKRPVWLCVSTLMFPRIPIKLFVFKYIFYFSTRIYFLLLPNIYAPFKLLPIIRTLVVRYSLLDTFLFVCNCNANACFGASQNWLLREQFKQTTLIYTSLLDLNTTLNN